MTTEKSFHISGHVKNLENKPVPALRVEAWDKDLFFDDFLAEAVTGSDGRFSMSIPEGRFEEIFFDKRPDLYFKVRSGSQVTDAVIADTSDSVLWNVESGDTELEQPIVVDIPVEEEPEPEPEIGHRLVGQLLNEETGEPLMGFKVRAFDLDTDPPMNLGYDITNGQGLFVVLYTTPAVTEEGVSPERNLRLHIDDREGNEIHQVVILIQVDQEEVLEVTVPVAVLPQPVTHPLDELVTTLNLEFPEFLRPFLAEHEIHTLEDIRRSGGIRHLEGLPVAPDDPAVSLLEAHAVLTVLSQDVELNAKLIDKGFTSLVKIAQTPRSEFVMAMFEEIGDFQAAKHHAKAMAQTNFLKNVLAHRRVEFARNPVHELDDPIDELYPNLCQCEDCEAAVSPLAYLADLLKYATESVYLESGDTEYPISLGYLEQTFRQPFGQLTASCEEMSREVRQVRLCIEVLRRYLGERPLDDVQKENVLFTAEREYRSSAYSSLLSKIGTSYDDVRLIPTLDEEGRKRLTDRLGIHPEHLDDLLLTDDALTEKGIETLFGLVDTTRNPLSDGAKIGDDSNQIIQWKFNGVEWKRNTDMDGNVYVKVKLDIHDPEFLKVSLYRDQARTQLVAYGRNKLTEAARFEVSEQNNSGLSASFRTNFFANLYVDFSVIPDFVCWRLKYLQDQWREQDWPTDQYSDGVEQQRPVIDPDLIGPDDLRLPIEGEPFFDLWKKRRQWVDDQIEELEGKTKNVTDDEGNTIEVVPDLEAMFMHMGGASVYPDFEGLPWIWDITKQDEDEPGTPIDQFDAIREILVSGTKDEVAAAREQIWKDLCLTVEAFIHLMEIRDKDKKWWEDFAKEQVSNEEWREVYSILVQAEKERWYSSWCVEETGEGVGVFDKAFFGPKHFWISLSEPEQGNWPPVNPKCQPMIDPELVELVDLPDSTVGRTARELWETRQVDLEDVRIDLQEQRESSGFDSMLLFALAQSAAVPDSEEQLEVYLTGLEDELNEPGTTDEAKRRIVEELFLSSEDTATEFNTLMDVRRSAPDGVSDEEWKRVYIILTSANKRCEKYPQWIEAEETLWLEAEGKRKYWQALKARLPQWRASAQTRRGWQEALRGRSNAPNIEPDLIDTTDLRVPFSGDTVFDIWKDRHEWVGGRLKALEESRPIDIDTFDSWVNGILEISPEELAELLDQFENGEDITARLEQLNLARDAFTRLVGIRKLVASDISSVRDDEWDEVDSIIVQIMKRREFAQWRYQEQQLDKDIVLCADHFKLPEPPPFQFPPPELRELPQWRATWRDKRDWQDRLESRIDQAETVVAAVKEAVGKTEEATLPMLRDALITASDAEGYTLTEKAKWIAGHLLIDAKAGGCQRTTRIAQALETIQTLLFSLRIGQLRDAYPELYLKDDDFDEKWQWLGAYAYWRAAMFVFLYPENVLLPHLRQREWKTTFFRDLERELRGTRLTPEDVCYVASKYADRFDEICWPSLEAAVVAKTATSRGSCRETRQGGEPELVYLFARGEKTKTVYASRYDPTSEDQFTAHSLWEPVSGLKNVIQIVGASVYETSEDKRYIYLFARVQEGEEYKLVFTTYDLQNGGWGDWNGWTGSVSDLTLPERLDGRTLNAVVVQTNRADRPPRLLLHCFNRPIYYREINQEGSGWRNEDDEPWVTAEEASLVVNLLAVVEVRDQNGVLRPYKLQIFVEHKAAKIVRREYSTGGVPSEQNWSELGTGRWCGGFPVSESRLYTFWESATQPDLVVWLDIEEGDSTHYRSFYFDLGRIVYATGKHDGMVGQVAYTITGFDADVGLYRSELQTDIPYPYDVPFPSRIRITPKGSLPFGITEKFTDSERQIHRYWCKEAFLTTEGDPRSVITYLEEAWYFVPVHIALQLQRRRQYTAALSWFRTVFDYTIEDDVTTSGDERKIYYGLEKNDGEQGGTFERPTGWLLDPLNPHEIVVSRSRAETYTRFTILSIIHCLLDYADTEFTQDSAESLPRARTLYMTALELLDLPQVNQALGPCATVIDEELSDTVGELNHEDAHYQGVSWALQRGLTQLADPETVMDVTQEVRAALQSDLPLAERSAEARNIIDDAMRGQPHPSDFASVLDGTLGMLEQMQCALLTQDSVVGDINRLGQVAERDNSASITHVVQTATGQADVSPGEMELPWLRVAGGAAPSRTASGPDSALEHHAVATGLTATLLPVTGVSALRRFASDQPLKLLKLVEKVSVTHIPDVATGFCVPPNPISRALRLHAELNLYKLRNCRNIEGMEREIPVYGASTDVMSGMPIIGEAGQITLPGTNSIPGTPYRYDYLIERARHLADRAAQMEAAFLAALEKRDAEYYNLMKARQDIRLARAGVRLQDLRVREAEDGIVLAELQRERSRIQMDRYETWLTEGLLFEERYAIELLGWSLISPDSVSIGTGGFSVSYSPSGKLQTMSSVQGMYASYERRRQEWELHRDLAAQEILIGDQQITLMKDRVRVVAQERRLSQMQADFAEATADYLTNKFTNVELYDWMSQILEGVYGFFLQEATAVAKLAEDQLAFERQESPPALIQADYWEAPSDDMIAPGPDKNAPDRRGLTGSARLLEDIHKLDQYRFETKKRKLQLTKTISLARLDPFEFQRFRETGVMNFNTPLELFDHDFPGHYLRLIKRIRVSIIALLPPTTGIHATLSTTGLSRVAVGGMGLFQTILTRRPPESVALTSPRDATGLFELVPQSQEMMLPFESMGVDSGWELRMPKAANLFDYRTIADVLMTIEYTALDSYDYRQQVIRELDTSISADRPFSFRHQFPDAWYDLHNPDQAAMNPDQTAMTVRFITRREDFPPNIEDLKIQQVLLYFARKGGADFEMEDLEFYFTEKGIDVAIGGSATTVDGVISTRRANAGSWTPMIGKQPIGEWELELPDTSEVRQLFQEEEVEDILFVITYSGDTPPWPG